MCKIKESTYICINNNYTYIYNILYLYYIYILQMSIDCMVFAFDWYFIKSILSK